MPTYLIHNLGEPFFFFFFFSILDGQILPVYFNKTDLLVEVQELFTLVHHI